VELARVLNVPRLDLRQQPGQSRWQESILEDHLRPDAETANIGKIGWHTFRYTYSTMLRALGVDMKVQQQLLRHANIRTRMNIWPGAISCSYMSLPLEI
jgi:integrase